MCGIWALLGIDPTDLNIYEACNKLRPRGPDAFRMEFHKSITNGVICFQRLEIIDSIYGMQPMKLHRYPHIILICNGEIYNWTQLKGQYNYQYETECDVEAVIHLYMQYENDCAAILDAEFAFAIFDVKKKRLLLARDPYGVRPLYHLRTAEENGSIGLGISSEAKGLMDVSRVLTKRGIEHSLEQFPPSMYAEYSILDSGRLKLNSFKRYFEYLEKPRFKTLVPYYALHDKDVEANIRTLLMSAVEKRLMGDRRIGCLLSGGLDSSLIAALTVRLAKMAKLNFSIQTFSIGMSGQSPDIVCARKVADFIGSEHHEILFTEQDVRDALDTVIRTIETYDITTIRASLGMYLLSKYVKTKSDTTVLLSGEGADELAQGYIYFREAPNVTDANAESLRLLKDIYLYDGLRADRTTATHGLELRLPFLDLQFTSYFLNLPAESRTPQKGVEKYLLRHAFNDSNLLPAEILWRHKEAFSDGVANHERSLFSITQEFTASQISDEDMKQAKNVYPFNTPPTKEAFYYRKIFEEEFGPHERLTPYMWMPKWVEAKDPSARVLKSYSKDAVCCK